MSQGNISYIKEKGKYITTCRETASLFNLTKDDFDDTYYTFDDSKLENANWFCDEDTGKRIASRQKNRDWSKAVAPLEKVEIQEPLNPNYAFLDYQKVGIYFITKKKTTLLADEMGVGKTAQFIGACNSLMAEKILVVCPSCLKMNWGREFNKFSNRSLSIHEIYAKEDLGQLETNQPNVIIVNYELLIREPYFSAIAKFDYDIAAYDESHKLKSLEAQRTFKVLAPNTGLIHKADRNVFITGTPILNNTFDVYPVVAYAAPAAIHPFLDKQKFMTHFTICRRYKNNIRVVGSKNLDLLNNMLRSSIMVRRTKKDIFGEYGKPIVEIIPIQLDLKDQHLLTTLPGIQESEKGKDPDSLGSLSRERKQLSKAKIKPSKEFIDHLISNQCGKIAIFGHHKDALLSLQKLYKKFNPVLVNGDSTSKEKQNCVDVFSSDDSCQMFLGNISSAGTGLDGMQKACSTMVFIETNWDPATIDQAIARLDRKGQKEVVNVYILVVKGSRDDSVMTAIHNKRYVINSITK
jgi:SWI/SNF-related matrix-associated actin-dependent regulator of chromatin subfamily A-like protein 1